MLLSLQCMCDKAGLAEGDCTLHLLSHYSKDPQETEITIRTKLVEYIQFHPDKVAMLGNNFLAKKGLTVGQFCASMILPGQLVDELALLLTARVIGVHFCVLLQKKHWYSVYTEEMLHCRAILLYEGNLHFCDTQLHPDSCPSSSESDNDDINRQSDVRPPSPVVTMSPNIGPIECEEPDLVRSVIKFRGIPKKRT